MYNVIIPHVHVHVCNYINTNKVPPRISSVVCEALHSCDIPMHLVHQIHLKECQNFDNYNTIVKGILLLVSLLLQNTVSGSKITLT